MSATNGSRRTMLSNQTNIIRDGHYKPSFEPVFQSHGVTALPSAKTEPPYISEYGQEIVQYFLEVERVLYSDRLYMERQSEVTDRMRKILVDWIMDVVSEFKLHAETFYLAIDIIDRFLYFYSIPRTKLQLIGVTAVLIAAKHEEVWPPTINDCVAVTANTYTNSEVVAMEFEVVNALRFKFTVPTAYPIACHFLEALKANSVARSATFLFLESAAHSYSMLSYLPSRVAATAALLGVLHARVNAGETIALRVAWDAVISKGPLRISFDELVPIAEQMLQFTQRLCSGSSRLQALRRKYVEREYHSVANFTFPHIAQFA